MVLFLLGEIRWNASSVSDVRQVSTLMTEVEGYKRNSFECNILAAVKSDFSYTGGKYSVLQLTLNSCLQLLY